MTFFLRDKSNVTLVDIDLWIKKEDEHEYIELSASIPIEAYSKFLLNAEQKDKQKIITYFDALSEMRGWLWETYFMGRKNTPDEIANVRSELRSILDKIGDDLGLHRVED